MTWGARWDSIVFYLACPVGNQHLEHAIEPIAGDRHCVKNSCVQFIFGNGLRMEVLPAVSYAVDGGA